MITNIDKQTLCALRVEMNEALQAVAHRHGLYIEAESATFTPLNATFKLKIAVKSANGVVETPERTAFKRLASLYRLQASDLDRTFSSRGETYKICGLKTKSYRRPILCVEVRTGRIFRFTVETVANAFALLRAA